MFFASRQNNFLRKNYEFPALWLQVSLYVLYIMACVCLTFSSLTVPPWLSSPPVPPWIWSWTSRHAVRGRGSWVRSWTLWESWRWGWRSRVSVFRGLRVSVVQSICLTRPWGTSASATFCERPTDKYCTPKHITITSCSEQWDRRIRSVMYLTCNYMCMWAKGTKAPVYLFNTFKSKTVWPRGWGRD